MFLPPTGALGSLLGSQAWSSALRSPLRLCWSGAEGKEEERRMGRGPLGSEDQGEACLVFPLPTWAPGSLLGSWAWSSALQGALQPCGS